MLDAPGDVVQNRVQVQHPDGAVAQPAAGGRGHGGQASSAHELISRRQLITTLHTWEEALHASSLAICVNQPSEPFLHILLTVAARAKGLTDGSG